MEPSTSWIRVKMRYGENVRVMTMASKGDEGISSMRNLRKLVYRNFPDLENSSSSELKIRCKDDEGDLVTIEDDGDLASVIKWQLSNLTFELDLKKQDPAPGRGKEPSHHHSFAHERSGGASTTSIQQQPFERNSIHQMAAPARTSTSRVTNNFESWLRQQLYQRDASENISFLSRGDGLGVLSQIVQNQNLPDHCIVLVVKLLSREGFRLSLMLEYTNQAYSLLIGSMFLFQLPGHIRRWLATARAHEILPYLELMEELQSRTTEGFKEVPLDTVKNVVQKLPESSSKTDLLMMVNRLIDHRKQKQIFHKQASSSSTSDENRFMGTEFRSISIVPDKSELLQAQLSEVPVNLVERRYASVFQYLETHFLLLREDFIHPLRQGINDYRNQQSTRELRIYPRALLVGYRCGDEGLEYVVSIEGSQRNLEDSKRLMFGTLVCLSSDGFQNSFIFGVVTGKSLMTSANGGRRNMAWIRGVGNPGPRAEASVLHGRTYVMAEPTTAYFEAYFHVLRCLQRKESIPFTQYLLDLKQEVAPPLYLLERANGDEFNFETVFPSITAHTGNSLVHILQDWPYWPSTLDEAQLQALKHGLTKELSIIQGPPGTGETFLGLLLVRLLLANLKAEDGSSSLTSRNFGSWRRMDAHSEAHGRSRKGPILIICMTNHALDQFLEGIFKFEKNLVRIGAQSKSNVLQERTLKTLVGIEKQKRRELFSGQRSAESRAWVEKSGLEDQIRQCVERLDGNLVKKKDLKIVATDEQIQNLFSVGFKSKETLELWLAGEVLPCLRQPHRQDSHHQGLSKAPDSECTSESDEEHPKCNQGSGRSSKVMMLRTSEDEDEWQLEGDRRRKGIMKQETMGDLQDYTLQVEVAEADLQQPSARADAESEDMHELRLEDFVDFPNVWRLDQEQRKVLHEHWLGEVKKRYDKQLQELNEQYLRACRLVRQVEDEIKLSVLRKANVVGVTTTTAARFHEILKSLNSEILIVEEAAEVLEGHILATLSSNMKHLVLIGDHMQLRPSVAVYQLGTIHNLDVSMFERLVDGGVDHVVLQEQHRMRPAFSKLVRSLYPKLKDHPSVSEYDHVRGVASNLLFFDHTAEEDSSTDDSSASKINTTEAKLVVELTLYLMKQECYSGKNIAILTMYTGQLLVIRRLLQERAARRLSSKDFERMQKREAEEHGDSAEAKNNGGGFGKLLPRVSSVDDFQGEEADIVILSLVRSNSLHSGEGEGTIGFLNISNRVCVALTRAKKGMYIFGNATLIAKRSAMWNQIIGTLRKDIALDTKLELVCQNHPETRTIVTKEDDFHQVEDGGCNRPCEWELKCGHVCPRRCHPAAGLHEDVVCSKQCSKTYTECGHTCTQACHASSDCPPCNVRVMKMFPDCGHCQSIRCCSDPEDETCQNPCPKTFECLHKCPEVCGLPCPEKCVEKVARDLHCGHKQEIPCHQDPGSYPCKEPCRAVLPNCGHTCRGSCGQCRNGTEHISCFRECGRILPCGHACQDRCFSPCPPCTKQCEKRCFHGKCQLLCGQMCVPCWEPCPWRCVHHKCALLCDEICYRPRCDAPCKNVLSCGHLCIGLCEEPCPTKCRACHPQVMDGITQKKLGDTSETDRFVQLQECKHLFEVSVLDTWMDSEDTEDLDDNERGPTIMKLQECPQCRTPVCRSMRYSSVIKIRLEKLQAIQRRIFGEEKSRQGHVKLEEGDHESALVLFVDALEQNPTLMDAHLGAGRTCFAAKQYALAAVFLSFVVEKSSYAAAVRSVLKDTAVLGKELQMTEGHCSPPENELAVQAMLQLASVFTAMGESSSAEKLYDAVNRQSDNH